MNGVDVTLTWTEVRFAVHAGVARQMINLAKGRRDAYGASSDNGWQLHIQGALGECAIAKLTNRYWTGNVGDLDYGGDVGPIHVRTTARHDGRLIMHDEDPDGGVFVLVTGCPPVLRVMGWMFGWEAKQPTYWENFNGRPAFFVPAIALHPIADLPAVTRVTDIHTYSDKE